MTASVTAEHCQQWFQEQVLPGIYQSFQGVFRAADQAILQLAKNSSLNKEQNRYFEAAQSLRIIRFEMLERFSQMLQFGELDEAFASKIDAEHLQSLERLISLSPEQLAADPNLSPALADLSQRLTHIDANAQNPLAPDAFLHSFLVSLCLCDVDIHTKVLLLRLFESKLYQRLPQYVGKLNDVLSEQSILPDLHSEVGELTYSVNALVDKALTLKGELELSEKYQGFSQVLEDIQVDDVETFYGIQESDDVVSSWRDFLYLRDFSELIHNALDEDGISDYENNLLRRIPPVTHLFELISDDQNLSILAKSLLLSLHLPYVRIALVEENFLQDNQHPAQALLRELVSVADQWDPKLDDLLNDSLYNCLTNIVQVFIEAERVSSIDYQSLNFELLAYLESRRQKQQASAKRFEDSEYSAQISERARVDVSELIEKKMKQASLPIVAAKFIQEAWSHVLYVNAINKGVGSKEWSHSVTVLDQLLKSFQEPSAYKNRSELLMQLPTLLRRLRESLVDIHMDNHQINQWFDSLESAHKSLAVQIGGKLSENPLDLLERASENLKAEDAAKASEPSAEVKEANAEEQGLDEASKLLLSKLAQGVWLNWQRPDGVVRCQMAAFIKHTSKYILIDRSGNKIANLLDREMANKLKTREITLVDGGAMFDKTLASVIGGIRSNR